MRAVNVFKKAIPAKSSFFSSPFYFRISGWFAILVCWCAAAFCRQRVLFRPLITIRWIWLIRWPARRLWTILHCLEMRRRRVRRHIPALSGPGEALPHREVLLNPINKDLDSANVNHGIICSYIHSRPTMAGFRVWSRG